MKTNPIILFAKWQVKEGFLDSVLNLLTEVAKKSEDEDGNLFYELYQSRNDPNTLMFCEGYSDDPSLTAHQGSEYFQTIVINEIAPMLDDVEIIQTESVYLKKIL